MKLVEARGDSDPGRVAGTVADPIPDVRGLLDEIAAAGLDPDQPALISFHLCLPDRPSWERAADAAKEGWRVSAYSRAGGHMLQLSRQTTLAESDVERERAAIVAFATEYGAVAESVTVEELARPNTWKALAAQQVEAVPAEAAPELIEEPTAVRKSSPASGSNIA